MGGPINMDDLGGNTPIFGHTHIFSSHNLVGGFNTFETY